MFTFFKLRRICWRRRPQNLEPQELACKILRNRQLQQSRSCCDHEHPPIFARLGRTRASAPPRAGHRDCESAIDVDVCGRVSWLIRLATRFGECSRTTPVWTVCILSQGCSSQPGAIFEAGYGKPGFAWLLYLLNALISTIWLPNDCYPPQNLSRVGLKPAPRPQSSGHPALMRGGPSLYLGPWSH